MTAPSAATDLAAGHRCADCGESAVVGFGARRTWLCQEHFEQRMTNDLGAMHRLRKEILDAE